MLHFCLFGRFHTCVQQKAPNPLLVSLLCTVGVMSQPHEMQKYFLCLDPCGYGRLGRIFLIIACKRDFFAQKFFNIKKHRLLCLLYLPLLIPVSLQKISKRLQVAVRHIIEAALIKFQEPVYPSHIIFHLVLWNALCLLKKCPKLVFVRIYATPLLVICLSM